MFGILKDTIKKNRYKMRGVDLSITHRTLRDEKYRINLAKVLKQDRKNGDRCQAHNKLIRNQRRFEYLMAKYGSDKQGLLKLMKFAKGKGRDYCYYIGKSIKDNIGKYKGLDKEVAMELIRNCFEYGMDNIKSIFCEQIDKFEGLDRGVLMFLICLYSEDKDFEKFEKFEDIMFNKFSCFLDGEVAKMLLEKIKSGYKNYNGKYYPLYFRKFLKNLYKFSIDIEFIKRMFFDNYDNERSIPKSEMINLMIKQGCFNHISFDENFINYLLENNFLENENNLQSLKKILLDK